MMIMSRFENSVLTLVCLILAGMTESESSSIETLHRTSNERGRLLSSADSGSWMSQSEKDRAAERQFINLRRQGVDTVSHTAEANAMRHYILRKNRRKGLFRKREEHLSNILFPGLAPRNYQAGETIVAYTKYLASQRNPIPFDAYILPGCMHAPNNITRPQHQIESNLGTLIFGIESKPSDFRFELLRDVQCQPLCKRRLNPQHVRRLQSFVDDKYRVHVTLDGLPVTMRSKELNYIFEGYPVGFIDPLFNLPSSRRHMDGYGVKGGYFLYNHIRFMIYYTENEDETGRYDFRSPQAIRIVGFDAHPVSIEHTNPDLKGGQVATCSESKEPPENNPSSYLNLKLDSDGHMDVIYSYSVTWIQTNELWQDRWDAYLLAGDSSFGMGDSATCDIAIEWTRLLVTVSLIAALVAVSVVQRLRNELKTINSRETLEDDMKTSLLRHEDSKTGWEALSGDVFRPPETAPVIFSVFLGSGAQLLSVGFLLLLAYICGFSNPLVPGQVFTDIVYCYIVCGLISGYVASRCMKFCQEATWEPNLNPEDGESEDGTNGSNENSVFEPSLPSEAYSFYMQCRDKMGAKLHAACARIPSDRPLAVQLISILVACLFLVWALSVALNVLSLLFGYQSISVDSYMYMVSLVLTLVGTFVVVLLLWAVAFLIWSKAIDFLLEAMKVDTSLLGWGQHAKATAGFFPSLMICLLDLRTAVLLMNSSSATSKWADLLGMALAPPVVWVVIYTPSVLLGSYLGSQSEKIRVPTKTNESSREIPESQSWKSSLLIQSAIGGFVLFFIVVPEYTKVSTALYMAAWYYEMSSLLMTSIACVLASAGVSICFCFYQFSEEDHGWQWKSFWRCASVGLYILLYPLPGDHTYEQASPCYISTLLNAVPVVLMACGLGLICGVIGVVSAFWFTKRLYEETSRD